MSRRRAVTAATSDASGRAELGRAREASRRNKKAACQQGRVEVRRMGGKWQ